MKAEQSYDDGVWLPRGHGTLASGVPRAVPGAVHALALGGGYSVRPAEGRTVYFGRNRPEVHVCVGEDDRQVSRRHGELRFQQGRWWLRNIGRQPIRLTRAQWLFATEPAIPLADGYTRIHIPGADKREHLVEIYVTGPNGHHPRARRRSSTDLPEPHSLSADERLILTVLGQRYLLCEPSPKPLTWQQAAHQVAELQPDVRWTAKKIEHRVAAVRDRLSRAGVPDLTREEVGEPVGNSLNDNLLRELVRSTTLAPEDLRVMD
ncbi:hypothetical protein GCM10029964_072010 [Kibdelosporangium lantanae]